MSMNLTEALTLLNVDELKKLTRHLPGPPITGRKAELVNGIAAALHGPGLHTIWQSLSPMRKAALSEAVHDPRGELSRAVFHAKYGSPADFGPSASSPLSLFIYSMDDRSPPGVPTDLRPQLLAFVPAPAPVQIKRTSTFEATEGMVVRLTETDSQQELAIMLSTIAQERITVGEKTGVASSATQRLLFAKLSGGDFYPWIEKAEKWDQQVGPVKAFAWPLLLQAGGLATRTGIRLGLSAAGIKAQSAKPAEVIRSLWNKWLKTTLIDEFSRIDDIKGQNSAGRVMGAVAARRDAITQALKECPPNGWIAVAEFSRFMQASNLFFVVAHDPWKLFIGDRQYGSLGYSGSNDWNILQHRYILALLFEYAGTLGLIDVAYVDPTDEASGLRDFGGLWGTDDMAFLSRYDGLRHFRINALGTYVLGLADTYVPTAPVSTVTLRIMPSLTVGVVSGRLDTAALSMLETWAQPLPDDLWQLDSQRALAALEKGHDIAALRGFLQSQASTPLPDTVTDFILNCQRNAKAVKTSGTALLLTCRDAATAQHITEHPATQALCWRLDAKTLAVRSEQADKFRQALRLLGLGLVG